MDLLQKILETLIGFHSISPNDAGQVQYISDLLGKSGFHCIVKEYGEGDLKTKNLYAFRGAKGKNLVFSGHLDVVPTGNIDSWDSDPFKMVKKNDKIYGRGTIDMKSSVAAMIASLIEYKGEGRVAILLTSDEETGGDYGMKPFLEDLDKMGHKLDFVIVGEPTSNKEFGDIIKNGRRGSINFDLIIKGVQGHVAYPENATNPNNIAVDILYDLKKLKLDDGNEFFQPSNLEITSIDVNNNADNIIPESVKIKFNIRFNNIKTRAEIEHLIENIIAKHTKSYVMNSKSSASPFITKPEGFAHDFLEIVKQETARETKFSTSGGTSDARYIAKYSNVIEFGPKNEYAHKINEHIEISDLQKLLNVYYNSINSYHNTL